MPISGWALTKRLFPYRDGPEQNDAAGQCHGHGGGIYDGHETRRPGTVGGLRQGDLRFPE
ncbi:hypothetical protein DESC_240015 [Desulfosarcina cetonica]|nr:hypothetical protein DESC_240015 [Desulfosarcina cetonica]